MKKFIYAKSIDGLRGDQYEVDKTCGFDSTVWCGMYSTCKKTKSAMTGKLLFVILYRLKKSTLVYYDLMIDVK